MYKNPEFKQYISEKIKNIEGNFVLLKIVQGNFENKRNN